MKKYGRTWDNARDIVLVEARGLRLYRTAFGNGSSEDEACSWCGEIAGRLYCYDDTPEKARQRDRGYPGDLFCSLHCWGQYTGYTDL